MNICAFSDNIFLLSFPREKALIRVILSFTATILKVELMARKLVSEPVLSLSSTWNKGSVQHMTRRLNQKSRQCRTKVEPNSVRFGTSKVQRLNRALATKQRLDGPGMDNCIHYHSPIWSNSFTTVLRSVKDSASNRHNSCLAFLRYIEANKSFLSRVVLNFAKREDVFLVTRIST